MYKQIEHDEPKLTHTKQLLKARTNAECVCMCACFPQYAELLHICFHAEHK